MKRLIAILLILIFSAAMLTACGDEDAGLTGTYRLTEVTEGGETLDASLLLEFGLDISEFYVEFLDNSRFRMVTFDESEEGTYKLDGNTLTLSADGETIPATINNNAITIELDETIMVFEKS